MCFQRFSFSNWILLIQRLCSQKLVVHLGSVLVVLRPNVFLVPLPHVLIQSLPFDERNVASFRTFVIPLACVLANVNLQNRVRWESFSAIRTDFVPDLLVNGLEEEKGRS
jgi:hypothetical protein